MDKQRQKLSEQELDDILKELQAVGDKDERREELLAFIYNELERSLKKLIANRCHSFLDLDAEDIFVMVFMKIFLDANMNGEFLYKKIGLKKFSELLAFFMHVVRFTIQDRLRYLSHRHHESLSLEELIENSNLSVSYDEQMLFLLEAIDKLRKGNPRAVQVIEFASYGYTNEQIAEKLDISLATVKRDRAVARAFLYSLLYGGANTGLK